MRDVYAKNKNTLAVVNIDHEKRSNVTIAEIYVFFQFYLTTLVE